MSPCARPCGTGPDHRSRDFAIVRQWRRPWIRAAGVRQSNDTVAALRRQCAHRSGQLSARACRPSRKRCLRSWQVAARAVQRQRRVLAERCGSFGRQPHGRVSLLRERQSLYRPSRVLPRFSSRAASDADDLMCVSGAGATGIENRLVAGPRASGALIWPGYGRESGWVMVNGAQAGAGSGGCRVASRERERIA
jgi:hypothetical protein